MRRTLQEHEEERKEKDSRSRQGLKEKRDKWLEQARIMPSIRKKAEGMAERFQRQIDRERVERAEGKADIYSEREWALEIRNTKDKFSRMREQVMQTDITALERGATDTTPARIAGQTAEKHMDNCFNKHRRNDEKETAEDRAACKRASV